MESIEDVSVNPHGTKYVIETNDDRPRFVTARSFWMFPPVHVVHGKKPA